MLRQTDIFITKAEHNKRLAMFSDYMVGSNMFEGQITPLDPKLISRLLVVLYYERDYFLLTINMKTINIILEDYKNFIDLDYGTSPFRLFKLFKINKIDKILADNLPMEFLGVPNVYLSDESISTVTFVINKDGYFGFIINTDMTVVSTNVKNIYVKSRNFYKKKKHHNILSKHVLSFINKRRILYA